MVAEAIPLIISSYELYSYVICKIELYHIHLLKLCLSPYTFVSVFYFYNLTKFLILTIILDYPSRFMDDDGSVLIKITYMDF